MVAAGSGSRLGAGLPKGLVPVAGVPLVRRAVDALVAAGVPRVVAVVPATHVPDFRAALHDVAVPTGVVVGGSSRQESVGRAVAALAGEAPDAVVLVHDAARPFVPAVVVTDVVAAVLAGADAAVPAVPVVDTIRRLDGADSVVVDRETLRAVQTPQGFRLATLAAAHERLAAVGGSVTDDAAAVEAVGGRVVLVAGHPDAFKVTGPGDLLLAEAMLTRGPEWN